MALVIPFSRGAESPCGIIIPTRGIIREQQKLLTRAPGWGRLRNDFIKASPSCAACGAVELGMQVHHIQCVHIFPELELVWTNLITLCSDHHLKLGHGGNWKKWNRNIVEICRLMLEGVVEDRDEP